MEIRINNQEQSNNNVQEIWKDVRGYEGLYQVSNLGRVRSFFNKSKSLRERGGLLLQQNVQGYMMVTLYDGKHNHKKTMVHRIVAEAFIPNTNPSELLYVNHKDENTTNNNVFNLEWCTHAYNINYGTRNERCARKQYRKVAKYSLDGKYIKTYDSFHEASVDNHISWGHISQVCTGKRHKAGGFKWKYV